MKESTILNRRRAQRVRRTRAKISGTAARPRLAIFRSNRFIYAQLINDQKGATLVQVSSRAFSAADKKKKKSEQAHLVGALLAKKALEAGISEVVLDRRHYKFHGRVKEVAEGVRQSGIRL